MKRIIYCISFFLLAYGCKKGLPYTTVTIENKTFGCRINGKPFIADEWDYGYNIPPVHVDFWYSPVTRGITHLMASGNRENEKVGIFLNPPFVRGRRELRFRTNTYPWLVNPLDYGSYSRSYPDKEYITNDSAGGFVDILYVDTINQKIEARFEFTGIERTSGERISVTHGYFRIK